MAMMTSLSVSSLASSFSGARPPLCCASEGATRELVCTKGACWLCWRCVGGRTLATDDERAFEQRETVELRLLPVRLLRDDAEVWLPL